MTKEELIEYLRDSFHDGHTHGVSKAIDEYVAQQWTVLCERQQTLLDEVNRLNGVNSKLYSALEELLKRYTELVECGDCGFWDAEKEQEVINARVALTIN